MLSPVTLWLSVPSSVSMYAFPRKLARSTQGQAKLHAHQDSVYEAYRSQLIKRKAIVGGTSQLSLAGTCECKSGVVLS